jgi:hypothetical protein
VPGATASCCFSRSTHSLVASLDSHQESGNQGIGRRRHFANFVNGMVSGEPSEPGSFPWHVSPFIRQTGPAWLRDTSDQHSLTAAAGHKWVIARSGLNLLRAASVTPTGDIGLACLLHRWAQRAVRGFKMDQQSDRRGSLQGANRKKRVKSAPSTRDLEQQYLDLQRLRQQVRIAECGQIANRELTGSSPRPVWLA